ncbi:MAG: family 43 glycosylhydrolase [Faecalicatena sp.]|uniref:family 43 glycosylhydrolase n=1 Tax=Faecalicatena sp. TaxID=2005360 RepID=UPI002586A860|nr:family 43 glycosylhydrolase [Faecalicatena sp.]MCI6467880.1 family 43 glycosylhydrolase [Faecalicatena sp.]MDY5619478.1 family 43 glycosylhydrolase [Lachnospiraceae bacterium]
MMKHYCNPMNLEYRYQFYRKIVQGQEPEPFKVYREAADPSLILFKDTYFLFPSMTLGFYTSQDLYDWEFHEFLGDIPIYDYAPDVRVMGEYLYFSASGMDKNCSFYRTKDPRTEKFEEIPGTFPFWDPALFVDDDKRVYFYWGCSNRTPIYGVELNPETMAPLSKELELIHPHPECRGYERFGNDHISPKSEEQIEAEVEAMLAGIKQQAAAQGRGEDIGMTEEEARAMLRAYMGNSPYIEGAWMTKHEGRYYLQYAIPGTEYNVYGDGVYVSDQPLGPFKPARNNPYSYKTGGFITGAGHGSTLEDKKGAFWHIASMRISHNENFERRLGLWKAGFDEDGELYCDQRFGDWPIAMEGNAFDDPDYMLLSYGASVSVSSGEGEKNITDEDIQTFWKAEESESGAWAVVDLGQPEQVAAVQINFADDGVRKELPESTERFLNFYEERWIDPKKQKTRWLLEGSLDGQTYEVLTDKRNVETDYAHDFIEFEQTKELRYIRLTVEALPYQQTATVSGIRVFGNGKGALPQGAQDVQIEYDGKMDMKVCWNAENIVGAVVQWGYAPEKLYHSRMVYGKCEACVGAIVEGEPVYVRVDTFNKKGITKGNVITVNE